MEITTRMSRHQLVARSAAAGSMVLLKNLHNTLPLVPGGSEPLPVAVFGVGQLLPCLWHNMTPWGNGTILSGLSANTSILPDSLLVRKYRNHLDITQEELPIHSLSMEEFAQENAAAIVVITRSPDSNDVNLSAMEKAMVKAVGSAFERSVLVLNTPGYVNLDDVADQVSAMVYMGIAGQEGGHALADLLTGQTVFTGRLAKTWPLVLGEEKSYCHYDSVNEDVRYPFGYGLYYGACALDHYAMGLDETTVFVEATFQNTSETYACRELAQVYVSTPQPNAPVYTLKAFAKTPLLQPGASAAMKLTVAVADLARYDSVQQAMVLDKGYYDIRLGTNSRTTFVAGSIFVPKDMVVSKAKDFGQAVDFPLVTAPYTYSEEAEELKTARSRAIRLPMRLKQPKSVSRWKQRAELPASAQELTYGNTTDYTTLVSQLSMENLESLLNGSTLPAFGIPAMATVQGVGGLNIPRYLRNDKGEVYLRRYLTAFPVPSLLACSFDQELIASVGQAIGCEAKEFGFHLYTDVTADWSEDDLVSGYFAAWYLQGLQTYVAASLQGGGCNKAYEIAISLGKPMVYNGQLPMELLQGSWGFKGAHYDWEDKATAQQSALSLIKLMATLKVPGIYQ